LQDYSKRDSTKYCAIFFLRLGKPVWRLIYYAYQSITSPWRGSDTKRT